MGGILDFIFEPLRDYHFMRLALVTGIMVGSICAILSCFLVVKRWALLGDAISHSVLPGVAFSYMLGLPYFVGALLTGLVSSWGIGYLQNQTRLKEDASMGTVFTAAFALGVAIISMIRGRVNLYDILFGNILVVSSADFLLTAIVGLIVIAFLLLFYRPIVFWIFDPVAAQVAGISTKKLHYLMMFLLTATIVASLHTVGIVMVVAMLIIPGAASFLLTYRFSYMIILSLIFGIISSLAGLYLSFYYDLATGAAMVLVVAVIFLIALVFSPTQGIVYSKR